MGLNGYQLFVESRDHEAVERAIREYVEKAGAGAVVDPDSDEVLEHLAERSERQFVLSTVPDKMMTVWEDGGWADRALAQALSETLRTRTVWLMISEATDSWAFAIYDSGKRVDSQHIEGDEPLEEAERFARREHLAFALEYLEEPDRDDPAFQGELEQIGYFDDLAEDRERIQRLLREAGDAPAEDPVLEEDDEEAGASDGDREVDREREKFVELTLSVRSG